jgi:hypothetical protein
MRCRLSRCEKEGKVGIVDGRKETTEFQNRFFRNFFRARLVADVDTESVVLVEKEYRSPMTVPKE